ncbi:MAG: CPBP family intramembrane metalloprotease [Caulobacterales bacterium]|nr:CPBP family intramembrane metalloprotease [Caulobacterales bacterium]
MTVDPASPIRAPFRGVMNLNAATAWVLVVLFCGVRFGLVMLANAGAGFGLVTPVFILMALLPFILLTRAGRQRIGLVRVARPGFLVLAASLAAGLCIALGLVFQALYAGTPGDAFGYVARGYPPVPDDPNGRLIMFGVVAAMSMLFSPIGEELFFRGLIHEGFRTRYGEAGASVLDASTFALVHLSHFGLIWTGIGWSFLPMPALIWAAGMFAAALLFSWARRLTGSLWGAVLTHMVFNLVMTAWIFLVVI